MALTYDWVHTNAQPGDCGCFGLNGGGISSSINFRPRWSVVADLVAAAGNSLTLSSYQGGLRYRISQPWMKGPHAPQPFAQVLLGGAHSSGQVAGAANGNTSFAFRIGGGVDLPINARFAVRVISSRLLFDFGQERSQRPPKQSFACGRHRLPLVSPALVVESRTAMCKPSEGCFLGYW